MNVWLKCAVIAFIAAVMAVAFLTSIYPRIKHPDCYSAGGKWATFPDSCVDFCGAGACAEVFTAGCDCGGDKCWNGTSCVPNLSDSGKNNTLQENVTKCSSNEDCMLVIAGCRYCGDCKAHSITDSDVIAVNKNLYKCPPKPDDLSCIACATPVNLDFYNNSICVSNVCQKKEIRQTILESNASCNNDSECVPAECCFSQTCVNIKHKPDCEDVSCIAIYSPLTANKPEDCVCEGNVCVNGKGKTETNGETNESEQVIPTIRECPEKEHINCMPSVIPGNEKYCIPYNREWIQENCNISYSD